MQVLALSIAQPVVLGLANGAGYGLVAIGLVLIYKSSRVFNFAAGEFVTVGAFGTYLGTRGFTLKLFGAHQHFPSLPYPFAVLLGALAGLGVGLLTERLVVRPLANRPKVTILVATAAVAIVAIAFELMIATAKAFPSRPAFTKGITALSGVPVLGHLSRPFGPKIGGVQVPPQIMLVVAALAFSGLVLAWFFARTDLGLATLATSQEAVASRLVGIRLNRISLLTWGAAGFLGGLAGVLLAPVTGSFTPGYGTQQVLIGAFTAAVLGGMTSVPGAFVGGLLVGLVQQFAQFNLQKVPFTSNDFPGANSVAVLVVLIAVLVIRPTGILGKEA